MQCTLPPPIDYNIYFLRITGTHAQAYTPPISSYPTPIPLVNQEWYRTNPYSSMYFARDFLGAWPLESFSFEPADPATMVVM